MTNKPDTVLLPCDFEVIELEGRVEFAKWGRKDPTGPIILLPDNEPDYDDYNW